MLLATLLLLLTGLARAAETVAVLAFDAHAIDADLEPLGRGVADMLTTDLQRAPGVRLLERQRIRAVLDELALQGTGFVDPETAVSIGRGLGADALVVGALTSAVDGLRLDARLVDVQTGEVTHAASATGRLESFFELERAVASQLLTALGADVELPPRDMSLDELLVASRRLQEQDDAYLARLSSIQQYKLARWRRSELSFQVGGGQAAVSTVKTWAVYDGGDAIIPPTTLAERAGDQAALDKMAKHRKTAKTLMWSALGVTVLGAGVGYGVGWQDGEPEFGVAMGALIGAGVGLFPAQFSFGYRAKNRYPANYWTPSEVDAHLERANQQIAADLGLAERDRREADLRP